MAPSFPTGTGLERLVDPPELAEPQKAREYGMIATGSPEAPIRPKAYSDYDGYQAYSRLVLAGSPLPDWTDAIEVGPALLAPRIGPVWAQTTYIVQPSSSVCDYSKVHHRLKVGHGRHLTIGLRGFIIDSEHIGKSMDSTRRDILGATGLFAAHTDERFAMDVLAENVLIVGAEGHVERVADMTRSVRDYSTTAYRIPAGNGVTNNPDATLGRAARWYLKGVQEGPTPEGIMWLCTGIETLVPPTRGRRRRSFNATAISDALREAGDDASRFEPNIGRVCDLRGRVVHDGEEEPSELRPGFYVLEEICRLLIRHNFDLTTEWPCAVPDLQPAEHPRVRKQYLRQFEWIEAVEEAEWNL